MDNRQPAYSGLFLLALICHNLPAQPISAEFKIILSAQHRYTASLPDAFNQAIPFYWQHLPTNPPLPSTMGIGWHHNYHFRLIKNDNKLELLKPDGTSQLYSPTTNDQYLSDDNSDDRIQQHKQLYHLDTSDQTIIFYGSYPVTIRRPDNSFIKLRYKDNVLVSLFDQNDNKLLLSYADNGTLAAIIQSDGTSLAFNYDQYNRLASSHSPTGKDRYSYSSSPPVQLCLATSPLAPQLSSDDEACNTDETPPPRAFQQSQLKPYSIKLDLRPQSCHSYFVDYNGIDRGVKLEAGMQMHSRYSLFIPTIRSFPVVDFIDGREAVAVYTKDLTSKTYNSINYTDGLYKSIIGDAQKAYDKFLSALNTEGSVSATEKGVTTTLTKSQLDAFRMELMIQAGVATPVQLAQIERARITLLAKWNIDLLVVVIP